MKFCATLLIPGVLMRIVALIAVHLIMLGLIAAGHYFLAFAWALVSVGPWAVSVFWLGCPRGTGVIHRLPQCEEVLLTFDDGPHPQQTPQLLDALKKHGVKAVFFVIGDHVKNHPALLKRIIDEGHLIGNHTMTHPVASFWIAGPWRIYSEIQRCQETITSLTGQQPQMFRPPVGHYAFFLTPLLRYLGLVCCAWSRRAFDGVDRDVERTCARLMHTIQPGDILVMHESNPNIVTLIHEVMDGLKQRGLKSFSDLQHDQIIVKRRPLI
jgi:peptidoglycan/xylan/chitin deacetylase (PgdA/CDA1 family)